MKYFDTALLLIIICMGLWITYRDMTQGARDQALLEDVLSGYVFDVE